MQERWTETPSAHTPEALELFGCFQAQRTWASAQLQHKNQTKTSSTACSDSAAASVQTQLGESWTTFGRILTKNCPRNSSGSYFNRLGQEQREFFGAICHKFAPQTRELHVLYSIRTLSQCPQHKLFPPPNALYTIISLERCKQHNLWCKGNSWLLHANLQGEPGENRGEQLKILVLTDNNKRLQPYFKIWLILFWGVKFKNCSRVQENCCVVRSNYPAMM